MGGVGGTPEGCINVTPFIDALQANDPFNRSPTVALPCCAPRALHRRTSDIRPSSRTVRVGAARPNSAPSKKCILCDRHHTASAMAELACYLSIVPHMRSFDVPPKHSAPLTRGLFCAARLSASRTKKAPPASGAQVGTPWMWTLAFGHHEDRTDTRLCRDARGRNGGLCEELAAGVGGVPPEIWRFRIDAVSSQSPKEGCSLL